MAGTGRRAGTKKDRMRCGCASHAGAVDRAAAEAAATLLGALADPTRLGIVELLSSHDRMCVCDISAAFPVNQPTISHHLRLLREAAIVDVVRRGRWSHYGLRRDALKSATQHILRLI